MYAITIPAVWIVLSFLVYQGVKQKAIEQRGEYLLAFTSVTVSVGLLMLIFFALSGVLPYLLIGGTIE
jgi:hypothetical protein